MRKIGNDEWNYTFDSLTQAAKELTLYNSNISAVINGKLKSTGGYEAKYKIIKLLSLKNI